MSTKHPIPNVILVEEVATQEDGEDADMNKDTLISHIIAHTDTLYYVSFSLLFNKADQEDAVQQCIEKALKKYESIRDEAQVKTWLTRILVNECYNTMRKRKREFPSEVLLQQPPPDSDGSVFYAIMQLDEKLRLPIVLHYQQGYTTKEISHILRTPEGTIKSRLVKGRKMLQELLHREGVFV